MDAEEPVITFEPDHFKRGVWYGRYVTPVVAGHDVCRHLLVIEDCSVCYPGVGDVNPEPIRTIRSKVDTGTCRFCKVATPTGVLIHLLTDNCWICTPCMFGMTEAQYLTLQEDRQNQDLQRSETALASLENRWTRSEALAPI